MKIAKKTPKIAETESQSGIPSGIPSGDSGSKNSNTDKARQIYEQGLSKRSLSTLERLSGQELDFILREGRDPAKDEISKKTIESSKEVVSAYISSLEAIKQARANEPLNEGLKTIAQAQSGSLGEIVGANAGNRVSLALLIFASLALALDSLIGFDNIRKFFGKKRQKDSKNNDEDKK
ncbi:MAG: hypothetical protein K2N45_05560 [Helicobacter japonicus]|nr:hypothetical protein [Helicobacter japonicus]